jgi:hypothetical protein
MLISIFLAVMVQQVKKAQKQIRDLQKLHYTILK